MPVQTFVIELHEEFQGRARLVLRGWLDAESTAQCWRELEKRFRPMGLTQLEVDASQLKIAGGIGAALLRYLSVGGMTPGARVDLQGVSPEVQSILDTFTSEDYRTYRVRPPAKISIPTRVGAVVRSYVLGLREDIAFLGQVVAVLPRVLASPRQMRWREVRRIMETAGANALPVVALVSALVGSVVVLEAAHPLAKFGAQIFLADMIGFAALRNTGPVVTAILLAGRSSSAFAAELGTMKVNQELDALATMGLNPVRYLVIQRVLAAFLLTPILTLYAMLMGIFGGLLIMRSLGFPPLMIYHQMRTQVGLSDLLVGLLKAAVFGIIIGGIGCLRGLQTEKGPSAVGVSTTRSVIAGILLIILANTLFSAMQYFWS